MIDRRKGISLIAGAATLAGLDCAKTENGAADSSAAASSTQSSTSACSGDNGGITLPAGFCATVFADTLGHPRHIVVSPKGDVYVNTWSGTYFTGP
ncbi:MAG TPA: hypothetical protein VLJ83_08195, partial [Gemmatimonadaceae bacterium]|nr:hypothetical protein [Gemmatimonadaceae bacterium]